MKKNLLVHKHLIIRAEASKPPTDEEQLKEWMIRFIDSINMKVWVLMLNIVIWKVIGG